MLNMLKKSFPVDYDAAITYPSKSTMIDAVVRHCGEHGWNYRLCGEDKEGNPLIEIEGMEYCVLRHYYGRFGYTIVCREI
nr:DUF4318 domain-containing protein [uncultured Agathobaculum sp.]